MKTIKEYSQEENKMKPKQNEENLNNKKANVIIGILIASAFFVFMSIILHLGGK